MVALDGTENFTKDLVNTSKVLFQGMKEPVMVGYLVKDLAYKVGLGKYFGNPVYADLDPYENELVSEEDQIKVEVLTNFIKCIKTSGLKYEVHDADHLTYHELVKQSIYSDLMILSYQIFFKSLDDQPNENLLFQILKGSRCPVLIIPEGIEKIDNVIFTYDSKESSVFAIRAFSNLFNSSFKDKIVSILTVTPSLQEEIENERLLMDLVKHHFNNVGLQLMEGTNTSQEIINFAREVENPLVIMGAFGRSTISNMILPSVAREIIKEKNIPLFIAHR